MCHILVLYCLMVCSVGLFSPGSDDVIVACVREVIDQLNQVSMSSFNPRRKESTAEFLSVPRKRRPCQL